MKQLTKLPYAYLHESIKNIDKLSKRVCMYLEIDPERHNLHVLSRQQEIVIVVEQPILAGQLKYQQKEILADLNRSLLSEYKTIRVKLSPPKLTRVEKKKVSSPLRQDISDLLNSVRSDLDTD